MIEDGFIRDCLIVMKLYGEMGYSWIKADALVETLKLANAVPTV